MTEVPFQLQYTLSRRQRLGPHLAVWRSSMIFMAVVGSAIIFAAVAWAPWFAYVLFGGPLFFWGFFAGIIDIIRVPVREMDVQVRESDVGVGVGVKADGRRWWFFMDGVIEFTQHCRGIWTIGHERGALLHIPEAAITEDQIEYLKEAHQRGRGAEGVRLAVERGKRLQALDEKRRNGKGNERGS